MTTLTRLPVTALHRRLMRLNALTATVALLGMTGCGGGGGDAPAPAPAAAPANSTAGTPVTAPVTTPVTVSPGASVPVVQTPRVFQTTVAASGTQPELRVLQAANGAMTTYVMDSKGVLPVQAVVKQADGTQARVYYGPNGEVIKAVNASDNSFITFTYSDTAITALQFDAKGVFKSGSTLQNDGTGWSTAPVTGSQGQIVATSTGQFSALVLTGGLTVGTATPLHAKLSALLPTTPATSMGTEPYAKALNLSSDTRKSLYSGLALTILGGVLSAGGAPQLGLPLAAVGVARLGEGIVGIQHDAATQLLDDQLSPSLGNEMATGGNSASSLLSRVQDYVSGKVTSFKDAAVAKIEKASNLLAGTVASSGKADTTPAPEPLPLSSNRAGTYGATVVDKSGKVYTGAATVDSDGKVALSASSSDGATASAQGAYTTASDQFSGRISGKDARGAVTTPDYIVQEQAAAAQRERDFQSNSVSTVKEVLQLDDDYAAGRISAADYANQRAALAVKSPLAVQSVSQFRTANKNYMAAAEYAQQASGSNWSGQTVTIGKCNAQTQSGGQGSFAYAYNLGPSSGQFKLSYNMYSIPDALTVVIGGGQAYSTGGLASGSKSIDVSYSGSSIAVVTVTAPDSSTQWTFTLGCGTSGT
jgi:hypothetical protein